MLSVSMLILLPLFTVTSPEKARLDYYYYSNYFLSKQYCFVGLQHNHIPGNFAILYKPSIVELHKEFDFIPKGYILPRDNEILRTEVSLQSY